MRGKFGRVLGDFEVYYHKEDRYTTVTDVLIKEGHAVFTRAVARKTSKLSI
jgi:hypothetical protein